MFNFIERNVGLIATAGIFVGLFGGAYLKFFENFVVIGIGLILVLAFLKIEFKEVVKSFQKPFWPITFSATKLIIAPLLVFCFTSFFFKNYQIGFTLLAATPAAMATAPLLLVLGGDAKIGLIVSVITNLLAPFILPFVLFYTIGATVELNLFSLFSFLALIIFIPFVVSIVIKRFHNFTNSIKKRSTLLTALILFFFNIGIVAPFSHYIFSDFSNALWIFLAVVFLSAFFHLLAFIMNFRSDRKILLVSIIVLAYFNTGLSVVLAKQYFDNQTVLITVLYEFIWNIGLIPLEMFFAKKREAIYNPAAN